MYLRWWLCCCHSYTVSLVCKYWNLTAFDDSLWDYIYM